MSRRFNLPKSVSHYIQDPTAGLPGDVYYNSLQETFKRYDGTQWVSVGSGPQGIQGIQGLQGLQGSGTNGAQGTQGTQGTQGRQGTQGNAGTVQGTQGIQGVQGIQGRQGTTGTQGTAGTGGVYKFGYDAMKPNGTSAAEFSDTFSYGYTFSTIPTAIFFNIVDITGSTTNIQYLNISGYPIDTTTFQVKIRHIDGTSISPGIDGIGFNWVAFQ